MSDETATLRSRALRLRDGRLSSRSDLGQTALVAVIAVSVIVSLIGATIVATVVQSVPLQQQSAVSVYAHRALEAGENAYVTAINANPTLAQCNTGTNQNQSSGLNYGEWNQVSNSSANGGVAQWYAFGNPQPTFDPTTHALTNLSVQVVGAARRAEHDHRLRVPEREHQPDRPERIPYQRVVVKLRVVQPDRRLLELHYNWKPGYDISGAGTNCGPVYFGPNDYLFGPVYTNDSVFVSGADPATWLDRRRSATPTSPLPSRPPSTRPTPTVCSSTRALAVG